MPADGSEKRPKPRSSLRSISTRRLTKNDIYHPTNAGHRIMADCLARLFDAADRSASDEKDIATDKPPVIGNDFVDTRLLDRSNAEGIAEGIARIEEGSFSETDEDVQRAEMDDHAYGTPLFPYKWMHTAASGNAAFRMTIRSRRLLLIFKDSGRSDFGSAKLWVDGRLLKIADPREVNWTHCNAVILYNEPVAEEHAVEIRMAPGHEDKRFTILGFGYVP